MKYDHLLSHIFAFLMLLGITHACLSQEQYWKSQLPNTPIPESIRDILQPNSGETNEANPAGSNLIPKHKVSDEYDPALFFLEKDLYPGRTVNLQVIKKTYPATFLPHHAASLIPFSTEKLLEILNRFSVRAGSIEGAEIENTLKCCELPPAFEGEERRCVTSLESMVDFIRAKLGENVRAVTTAASNNSQTGRKKSYAIEGQIKKLEGSKFAVCHKKNYVYAVYQCHTFDTSKAHVIRVPLKGSNALEAEPLAVCHNYAYRFDKIFEEICKKLNARPGVDTICHFLAQDTIVWALN